MKSSLREVLVESHVAAVAIAVLLFGAFDCGFQGLCVPVGPVATYSFTAIAILAIPYSSPGFNRQDQFMLGMMVFWFVGMLANLVAAWLLARWVYRVGPINVLIKRRSELARRSLA